MRDDVRALLCDLMAWHINKSTIKELRELRERVVLLTDRVDLIEVHDDDIGLHAKLIDAVMDYMDTVP